MHCRRFLERPADPPRRCCCAAPAASARWPWRRCCASRHSARCSATRRADPAADPLAPRPPHFPAKARSVIFLYMDGGPSQVDTFDPKPRLDREHGQPIKVKTQPTQFNNVGNVLQVAPGSSASYGESGIPVSDLFPHVGRCVDDLAIIRSMVSNFSEHTSANYFLHTGSGLQGRPSQGAWVTYGLGSECQDLPGFVVLNGGLIPPGGHRLLQQRLPARVLSRARSSSPAARPSPTSRRPSRRAELQRRKLDSAAHARPGRARAGSGHHDSLEAAIANYELAFRMQTAVPELIDLAGESRGDPAALRPRRSLRADADLRPASA